MGREQLRERHSSAVAQRQGEVAHGVADHIGARFVIVLGSGKADHRQHHRQRQQKEND